MHTQNDNKERRKSISLKIKKIAVFAMLGTIMFCSKILMEILPNIHLLGMLTMVYTLVFRKNALIPIYVYVMINGLYSGFSMWWFPYLYIWTILWGITMMLPQKMSRKAMCIVYPIVCGIHGFAFGTLYAPAQALIFGLDFKQTLVWITAGIPWDIVHGIGNLFAGLLILPLSETLKKLLKKQRVV